MQIKVVLLVAPYVGAWIETNNSSLRFWSLYVAPYVGAWIETSSGLLIRFFMLVAPYVGAWIETHAIQKASRAVLSHPTWVRGLKLAL